MLIQIFQLILCLSILIILHELGHFLPAKWFKTRVEKFYLFFNPWWSIVKTKIGDTEYGIGWLPFGGYVKIAGMIDSVSKKNIKLPNWTYQSKKPWQKLIIILGGVFMNCIFSWIIFSFIFSFYGYKYVSFNKFQKNGLLFSEVAIKSGFKNGDKIIKIDGYKVQDNLHNVLIDMLLSNSILINRSGYLKTIYLSDDNIKSIFNTHKLDLISPLKQNIIIDSLFPKSDASKSGLMRNDQIISINNNNIVSFQDFKNQLLKFSKSSVRLGIIRNKKHIYIPIFLNKKSNLGFMIKQNQLINNSLIQRKSSFLESIPQAWTHMMMILKYQIKQFKLIVRPNTNAYKEAIGPLRMFQIFDTSWNWELFWNMTGVLSIWLSFINLLPIPVLDGGHAIFILLEMITKKQTSEKIIEIAQKIGFLIILLLMMFIFGNDIYYWIQKIF